MIVSEMHGGQNGRNRRVQGKAERLIVQMEQDGEPIQLTRRGKVVGVPSPSSSSSQAPAPLPSAFGLLRSDRYRDLEPEDFVVDADWGRSMATRRIG